MLNSVACFHVTNLLTRFRSVVARLPVWLTARLRKRLRLILFLGSSLHGRLIRLWSTSDCAAAMLVVLRRDNWRGQLLHELRVVLIVRTRTVVIQHAQLRQDTLTLLMTLQQHAKCHEGLSLVADLVNNAVERCKVHGVGGVPEDLFFGHVDVDLVEGARFEKLHQQTGVRLPAYEDVNVLCVVAKVDPVRPQRVPLQLLQLTHISKEKGLTSGNSESLIVSLSIA